MLLDNRKICRWVVTLIITASAFVLASAQDLHDGFPFVVSATLDSWKDELLAFDIIGKAPASQGQIYIDLLLHSQEELDSLEMLKITFRVNEEVTTELLYPKHIHPPLCRRDQSIYKIINNYDCFRTMKGTNDTMMVLENDFPDLVTIMDIGYSYRVQDPIPGEAGYTIRLVKITSSQGIPEKAKVFVVAGIHGYGRQVAKSVQGILGRKNCHFYGCVYPSFDGVDLNRNFPFKYGGAMSDPNPCFQIFRGDKALSEVESQAIFDFAESIFPASQKVTGTTVAEVEDNIDMSCGANMTGVFLDLHSYGEVIIYCWDFEENLTLPDDLELQTMARKLASFGQYGIGGPGQPGFTYAEGGDTLDMMYGLHCVASFYFEVGENFPINYEALIYAAKVVSAPFKIPKGPDVLSLEVESTTSDSIIVTVLVSDEERSIAYGEAFAATGSQDIKKVRLFIDEHPYTTQNPDAGESMNPLDVDGFNLPTELASLEIDTKSLSSGQHVVYVEAEDSDGFKGPISVAFFDVRFPQSSAQTTFSCPLVPLIGIAANAYMMASLSAFLWAFTCMWLLLVNNVTRKRTISCSIA